MVKTLYLVTKRGITCLTGDDSAEIIAEIEKNEVLLPFTWFESGVPVYMAIQKLKNGNNGEGIIKDSVKYEYTPVVIPDPINYGMTAPDMYGKSVTYPNKIVRIIERRTRQKTTLAEQIKKAMTLILPICVALVIIFLMAVLLGG